jgi:hypothetical protein
LGIRTLRKRAATGAQIPNSDTANLMARKALYLDPFRSFFIARANQKIPNLALGSQSRFDQQLITGAPFPNASTKFPKYALLVI